MSKVLERKLSERSIPESSDAAKIVALVYDSIRRTKELSRGLLPVVSEAHGLMSALRQRAGELEDLFQIRCHFECEEPVRIEDVNVATFSNRSEDVLVTCCAQSGFHLIAFSSD